MPNSVSIQCDGSVLELGPYSNEYLDVCYRSKHVSIKIGAYLYTDGFDLARFFKSLAEDWKGWHGERRWRSIEGDVLFTAKHNGIGAVDLEFSLMEYPGSDEEWRFTGHLKIELGKLESIASDIESLFQKV